MEKTQPPNTSDHAVTIETRIQILFEEYRALYSLLTFRLTAMDRRLPAIGGTLAGILCSIPAMPDETRLAFLLGLPIAVLWLFLTTVQHARSKEDHLRRIDEIERHVNKLAGEVLLVFQSHHPNKARHPGGRTGFGSVLALLSICLLMIVACVHAVYTLPGLMTPKALLSFRAYSLACVIVMLVATCRLYGYRYRRPEAHTSHLDESQSPG